MADYCRECPECQKTACRRNGKPDEPFRRVGRDIIGKLTRFPPNNAYVPMIFDYTTRYPEAIPLPSIETDRICDALVEVFSRIGFPTEIASD